MELYMWLVLVVLIFIMGWMVNAAVGKFYPDTWFYYRSPRPVDRLMAITVWVPFLTALIVLVLELIGTMIRMTGGNPWGR